MSAPVTCFGVACTSRQGRITFSPRPAVLQLYYNFYSRWQHASCYGRNWKRTNFWFFFLLKRYSCFYLSSWQYLFLFANKIFPHTSVIPILSPDHKLTKSNRNIFQFCCIRSHTCAKSLSSLEFYQFWKEEAGPISITSYIDMLRSIHP